MLGCFVFCVSVQRKEYSELLNRHSDGIYVRVEVGEKPALRDMLVF